MAQAHPSLAPSGKHSRPAPLAVTRSELEDVVRHKLKKGSKMISDEALKGLWCVLDADNSNSIKPDEMAGFFRRGAPAKQPAAKPPAKKKRMVIAPVSTPAPSVAHDLDVQPRLALSEELSVDLKVKRAKVEMVDDEEQLGRLLKREADRALATHEQWARSPNAAWVQTLLAELGPGARTTLMSSSNNPWYRTPERPRRLVASSR